ncbi:MAG TPA: NAD(P)/FAD-dependent oxidoreductase [Candidatus Eremiobacteraceae bacterium]|jgi:phytoene dehydrogenase-like protein|nr:NAD(P)/FAD-dependent oxidoreductase [Candidatus Eremiobacteraceae bacterium]
MAQYYDVIVIGGGHNGLVNAAYLAKAGKKVLALERRHVLGGAAVTEEIIPGFLFSECSYVVSLLRPEIIRELDLPRHGLEILPLDGTFTPMLNGDYLWRMNDHARTQREIRRHSRLDAEAYDEFSKMMTPMCRFVKPMLSMIPPDPTTLNPRDLKQLHFMLQRFRSLSSDERYTLIQLMTMSAADFLDQWFETDALKATMSASGIIGTFLGIRSPGTAYVLLHHYMGEIDGAFRSWGFSRGGTGAISNAIGAAAREAGVEIRTQAAVDKILVKNGRAAGVVLKSGEEISATVVSSSVDPHLTFEKFLQPNELPSDFLEGVRRYKYRGSSGKVNIALDGLPEFKVMPGTGAHLRGAISISPGVEYMERAYDDAKYGNFSRRPYIDMVIPSLTDPSVAPPGKHVLSCFVQYAPYKLAQGTWDDQREAFGDTVVNTIAEHAPNIKKLIIGRQVLTPLDLEREFGLTQGNIFQGELSLEQLFFLRPVPGWAYYRTPIDNLYMCGSATHPGGGIMGAPGRIASQVILKEWKKSAGGSRADRSKPVASNGAKPHQQAAPPEPAVATAPPVPAPAAKHEEPALTDSFNEVPLTADDVANAPSDSTIAPDSEKN